MKSRQFMVPSHNRLAGSGWLSLALVTLLLLPPAMFATPRRTVLSPRFSSHAAAAPLAQPLGILFTVNNTGDGDRVSGGNTCDTDLITDGEQCSLRAAIQAANLNAGDDSIDFAIPTSDPGCDAVTGRCTINLTKALPDLSTNIAILGPGPDKLTVRRNTGGDYRIFHVDGVTVAVAVTLSGMTISNGKAISGGGILSEIDATLSVTNCAISGNFATQIGGGLHSHGPVNVTNSTISDNISHFEGGGFFIFSGAEIIVNFTGSTINDNFAGFNGGGIFARGATLNITNSTITGNIGEGGGGISNSGGHFNITNSTITDNRAFGDVNDGGGSGVGGGILSGINDPGSDTYEVTSSIIALNRAQASPDVGGGGNSFASGGFNLIGVAEGTTFPAATNQRGSVAAPLDPKLDLAGLQNNGGPTRTIALQPTSPAIDKGKNFATDAGGNPILTDQRGAGFARTVDDPAVAPATGGDNTDIGAFERQLATPTPSPSPSPTPSPSPSPSPTPTPPTFQFDAPVYAAQEDCTSVNVRVLRSGSLGAAATVDIASEDGTAKQKGDYTLVVGHLVFAAGEAEKTFQVLINDDSYTEGLEFATLLLQHPTNGTLGASSTATLQINDDATEANSNPIDDSETFVCTHYHDFLYRQADTAGEDFWTQEIEQCGTNAVCRQAKRVDVSTAFFLSIEFQQTGYLVIRVHKSAFGNLKSNPRYEVFLRDQRQIGEGVIVGQPGFQQQLDANRQKYLEDFVTRPEFVALFPQGASAVAYVELLFVNAGASPTQSERDAAIAAYGSGDTAGRAAALRSVVESGSVFNVQYNPAFVLMQYYGYLRRNPDDAPDNNFNGYDFWLAKMNSFTLPGEDARNESVALARVRRAEMVKAFIESAEYRQRFFGAPSGNQEVAQTTTATFRWKVVSSSGNMAGKFENSAKKGWLWP